ncbi:FecR family protein [Runella aurantiaca]|uniref:FecR family protein n=1 Tax=Runella aurantiaca TaxID=2282308 RepID=A0A369IBU9_9BACT|nr:FecR family protein [Runella aurantiaca]RDB07241.1 FecR family protein [Runella aurantiaca]
MNQYEFNQLLEKYLAGDCSPEEEKLVHEWQENTLKTNVLLLSEPEQVSVKKRLWQRITEAVFEEATIRPLHKTPWFQWAVAASVAIVLGGGWFLSQQTNFNKSPITHTLQTPHGIEVKNTATNPRQIHLEDGSVVILKANSSVTYPEHFGKQSRSVFLKGEAFFNVKRDPTKPFVVHAGELVTEVLGTSFTVKSYEDAQSIEVLVATGRVSVYENSSKPTQQRNGLILTPNQKIIFDKISRKLTPSIIEKPVVIQPPTHPTTFIFDETPLPNVLKKLENAYGLQIIIENQMLNQCVFTADLNELPLRTQLDLICKSVNASFEQRGTSIFIIGEGCK